MSQDVGNELEEPAFGSGAVDELDVDVADAADVDERELSSSFALFEGDEGTLEVDARRALVVLLKQRFITGRTHPREWQALLRSTRAIRAQLNNLFLELQVDRDREVAWKRQVAPEGGGRPFPTLLHDTAWGREETVLLVYLRSKFRHDQAGGAEQVYVDREDMLEHVAQLRPAHATNRLGDAKRVERAIESLYRADLLIGPSTGDRFEVSEAIEALVPLDKLTDLLAWLKGQNERDGARADGAGELDEDDDARDDVDGES